MSEERRGALRQKEKPNAKIPHRSLLIAGFAAPALAATTLRDSSGYCAVIGAHPAKTAGLKTLANASGYASHDAAEQALKAQHHCNKRPRPQPDAS